MRGVCLVVLLGIFSCGNAQQFPSRPVKLVVGFTPGGGVDIAARTLAPKLAELIGQPVVVENKPGAGTNIANEFVAKSAPDGTTLLVNTAAVAINQPVKSGRLRPLASTGAKRAEQMPEVPTMKEAGVEGVEVTVWYGVLAPAATPRPMVAALSAAIAKAAHDPEIKKRLAEQGAEPVGNTSEEFSRILREEVLRWAEVVKGSGARAD